MSDTETVIERLWELLAEGSGRPWRYDRKWEEVYSSDGRRVALDGRWHLVDPVLVVEAINALPALLDAAELLQNPAANEPHTARCIEHGWQSQEGGCYCRDDPRDPEEVLEAARTCLAALETPSHE